MGFQHLWLVAIFIYDHNFTISYDDLMTKLQRIYEILLATYDFSKIGPLVVLGADNVAINSIFIYKKIAKNYHITV